MAMKSTQKHPSAPKKFVQHPRQHPFSGNEAHPLYKSVLQSQLLRDPGFGIEIALPSDIAE
jgi:hypothetical protein